MKLSEITAKSDKELTDLIVSERDAYSKAVIDSRTKEVKNVKSLSSHKRTIARALTIQREREIAKVEQSQTKEQTE
jgi:ribosomal protein L29